METIKLNLESLDTIKKECKIKSKKLFCNNLDFSLGSYTLKKIIDYTDENILNTNDADNIFTNLAFINLIIDEDQINTNLGGDGAPILRTFNKYLLPTYLPLLQIQNVDNSKITTWTENQMLFVKWETLKEGNKCNIIDQQGKLVQTQLMLNTEGTISFKNLKSGFYLLQLEDKNGNLLHAKKTIIP